jgi:predicted Rossmann fold flavoprotein
MKSNINFDCVYDLAVIGGGASGYFAAINCAEANSQAKIVIIEKADHVLAKILVSGGGRCNLTHACFDPKALEKFYPRGGKAVRGAFYHFQPQDTMRWFEDHGIPLKTEADGRVFPQSDSSRTISECLIQEAEKHSVDLSLRSAVTAIIKCKNHFEIQLNNKKHIDAKKVLIAAGGDKRMMEILKILGHRINEPVPSLFTFQIQDPYLEDLAGISLPNVSLKLIDTKLTETGPILLTHGGLSGPAVLNLSAWAARFLAEANYQAELEINWMAPLNQNQAYEQSLAIKRDFPDKLVSSRASYLNFPHRLWQRVTEMSGIPADQLWRDTNKKTLNRLATNLTQYRLKITGRSPFKSEYVTCGGVDLKEVDFKTMESRIVPGLYLSGEILDIDAITGGFNFQNAWTTGWLAAQAIASSLD